MGLLPVMSECLSGLCLGAGGDDWPDAPSCHASAFLVTPEHAATTRKGKGQGGIFYFCSENGLSTTAYDK